MSVFSGFAGRMLVLAIFLLVSAAMFIFMLSTTGTRVPLLEEPPNLLTIYADDIENLVPASQVQIAGVKVGEVISSDATPEGGKVLFTVRNAHWPLHEGLVVRIGERSLVGESYLDIMDGTGAEIPAETVLPREVVKPGVTLYDIYDSLDPDTRTVASSMLQSLEASTASTKEQLSATMTGLGSLGREGHTAIDALSAQSEDLEKLAAQTATLLSALDTGQGQIANMVTSANRVTGATAGQRGDLEATFRVLPTTLKEAREASVSLRKLAGALSPVAHDLKVAGPEISDALEELPEITEDLEELLPAARDILDWAPDTLERIDDFSDEVSEIVYPAQEMLRDVNPMLTYLEPYGPDLAAFFANFNAALKPTDEVGRHFIRAMLFFNEKSLASPSKIDFGTYSNPYPKPLAGNTPGPFTGEYPTLERLPR